MGTSVFFNSKRWHSLVLRSLNPKPCCSWALCSLTPFAFGYFDPLKVGLWRSPCPLVRQAHQEYWEVAAEMVKSVGFRAKGFL